MKKIIFISILIFIMTSCEEKNNFKTIDKQDFTIEVPESLQDFSGQMSDNALLELADTTKKIYVVVEAFDKNDSIKNPYEDLLKYYIEDDFIDSTVIEKTKQTKYGEAHIIQAETIELLMDLSSTQTFWVAGLFPGKDKYYVLWTWTERIYKPDYEKTLNKIVDSFKVK